MSARNVLKIGSLKEAMLKVRGSDLSTADSTVSACILVHSLIYYVVHYWLIISEFISKSAGTVCSAGSRFRARNLEVCLTVVDIAIRYSLRPSYMMPLVPPQDGTIYLKSKRLPALF
jgi:hypothetical protein